MLGFPSSMRAELGETTCSGHSPWPLNQTTRSIKLTLFGTSGFIRFGTRIPNNQYMGLSLFEGTFSGWLQGKPKGKRGENLNFGGAKKRHPPHRIPRLITAKLFVKSRLLRKPKGSQPCQIWVTLNGLWRMDCPLERVWALTNDTDPLMSFSTGPLLEVAVHQQLVDGVPRDAAEHEHRQRFQHELLEKNSQSLSR